MILAVGAAGLSEHFRGTGFHAAGAAEAISAFHTAGLWLGPRETLEQDPSYRQIIPYVVLRYGDEFVRYTRTPAGGEARLHGCHSIGLGGHIDIPDVRCAGESVDLEATIWEATLRELREELGEVDAGRREWIGVITDDNTEVGRVHIGVAAVWHLRTPPSDLVEDTIGDVSLCSLGELQLGADRLETWSSMLLPHFSTAVETQAAA